MAIDFVIRPAESLEEAKAAQRLDDSAWRNGYQHYEWLYQTDSSLLLVLLKEELTDSLVIVE